MKKITFRPSSAKHLPTHLNKAMRIPHQAYYKHRYNTPLFVALETFKAFQRHNVLGLSASLSFYALFALVPLVLLMFFLLSQLVFSSDYAIVKLAIITGNLIPQLSSTIMVEVYSAAKQKAAWGALGLFILLWSVTPLASAMRSAFYNIISMAEAPSFVLRKIKDIFAIVCMLLLFFAFTFAGQLIEKVVTFLGAAIPLLEHDLLAGLISLSLTTLLISIFYYAFFPVSLNTRHILIGAAITATLWLMMRPAFTLFLSVNQSYGAVFGGMKNLFISITWLYFNFAVFLLGTELIATLRKKHVLLLKGLFDDSAMASEAGKQSYLKQIMQHYGKTYDEGEYIFHAGVMESRLYYLVKGEVKLLKHDSVIRTISPGCYFGEMAMLSNTPAMADAVVSSITADIITISNKHLETLLIDEPNIAMRFLKQLADRLQKQNE